ncbi:hypothetical protein KG086_13465 [Lacticaseibacillus chiayiensis]|uniref:Uncharacterized protein n=1 Tax=Lacticaseibacillus chiayiensis TaxID=2100821 RepID=A0ABY6H567_9LACO|nr:hypothetical protein [Lacticaseibacillus chiayiensis]QVI34745.1 hypothetical protein KG086_13465 [Lacticaseibacillus chiayiensis]UYN56496.1 hypothetical protein OFW50_13710 [Lacticaseibacillus chiayiensis]
MNRKQLHGIRLLTHALAHQIDTTSQLMKTECDRGSWYGLTKAEMVKRTTDTLATYALVIGALDDAVIALNRINTVLEQEDEKCEKAK